MDIFTLMTCTALICGSMVITLFALYKVSPQEHYLIDWLIAGCCFFTSNGIGLFLTQMNDRPDIFPIIANAFYMAGHLAVLSGIGLLAKNKHFRKSILAMFLVTIALHQFDIVMSSVENRIVTFYPMVIAMTGLGAFLLVTKSKGREDSKAFVVLIFTLFFFALQLALRLPLILNEKLNMMLVGSDVMQTSGTLFLMLYLFLLTISFSTIVVWRKEVKLQNFAQIDELSGWLNRRSLVTKATNEVSRSKREAKPLSFIMMDIDHFKQVNDQYGHAAGDAAIRYICQVAEVCKRDYDLTFRVGGEEFLIIAPDTSQEEAHAISERIRKSVSTNPLNYQKHIIELTVSLGIATSNAGKDDWEILYDRADAALYSSKERGRNKVTLNDFALEAVQPSLR